MKRLLIFGLFLIALPGYSEISKTIQLDSLTVKITSSPNSNRVVIISSSETKEYTTRRAITTSFEEYMIYDTYTDNNFKLILSIEPDRASIVSVEIQYSKNEPILRFFP